MITDGRVHDVPADAAALGFAAPLHALITGARRRARPPRRARPTRRASASSASRRPSASASRTRAPQPAPAQVTVRRDGEVLETRNVHGRRPTSRVSVPIPHAGPNIVEIEASPLDGELTQVNNRAVVSIDGVRDKLRVLLVSGEPHAGERTWRNLLKSDASVDLVHFTILRPPEKQDGTPINELSLIAFPTRELFQQKINEFQLIIFDRYARQGVLPMIYFDNIARLCARRRRGADRGRPRLREPDQHLAHAARRRSCRPSRPATSPSSRSSRALTDLGKRHPVTRGLRRLATPIRRTGAAGSASSTPTHRPARTVMQGPDDKPLLVLAREGKGRVALLLSDHIWLWARGYEGGGPHLDLLRRLSHWLMKQPELEEEALRLLVHGRDLTVRAPDHGRHRRPGDADLADRRRRRTLDSASRPSPACGSATVERQRARPVARDRRQADRARQCRPGQSARIRRSDLDHRRAGKPLANATGGDARRLADGDGARSCRASCRCAPATTFKGDDWIGLKMRDVSVVRGIGVLPIFAGLIGLLLLIGSLAATWAREGR